MTNAVDVVISEATTSFLRLKGIKNCDVVERESIEGRKLKERGN